MPTKNNSGSEEIKKAGGRKKQRSKYRERKHGNPDFRHRANIPLPAISEIEQNLLSALTPAAFAPLRMYGGAKLRERLLTLPVMVAIVVSMVWRNVSSLSDILRLLEKEGLLWIEALSVTKQALSKRLETLPAALFAQVFDEGLAFIRSKKAASQAATDPLTKHFSVLWIADGSTLEALQKRVEKLKDKTLPLAGKMMMVVETLTRLPVKAFYSEDAQVNDKKFADQLLELLPERGLLIFDLGFFSFLFFDQFSAAKKYFLTRLREKTAYEVVKVLSTGTHYRDEIIKMGMYRSNPCHHQVRLVSVLWGKTWYYYLTNVLAPEALSARKVCELYRSRWRIEDAFLLTKRLLGLSYLWVSSTNGVAIQIYATWVFYAVLVDLSNDVAQVLKQPLEKISLEMVFRSLYHYGRALMRGEKIDVVSFIAQDAKLFGIVKATLKRHREAAALNDQVWAQLSC